MKLFKVPFLISLIACTAGNLNALSEVAVTDEVIFTSPEKSILWKTIFSETFDVPVVWPKFAVKAQLKIEGLSSSVQTFNIYPPAESHQISVEFPAVEKDEKVLILSLDFYDGQEMLMEQESLKATLGLVRGTNEETSRLVPGGETYKKWNCFSSSRLVMGIDDDIVSPKINGEDIADAVIPGWYCWSGIKEGVHTVSCEKNNEIWSVLLTRFAEGTTLLLK
jgi:hypothetical protein